MKVSLVIPMFNEALNAPHLWERLCALLPEIPEVDWEVIFVDDGSTDETSTVVQTLQVARSMTWQLVKLSRNFGHQAAISAGMAHATGDAMIFLDADLQDPPELIPKFLKHFREGYDVVYGIRRNRKEPLWLRFCFAAFYRLFNAIADRPMPMDAGDFGLMSRRVAQVMTAMPESDRLLRGLRSWVGFKQLGVPYDRPGRYAGTSGYGILRRIDGALDGLFGFSRLPIRFMLVLGIIVLAIGGAYLASAVVSSVVFGRVETPGWKSIMTLAFMLGGANLVAVSIVGEYVCRIYFQAKQRPLYVVEKVVKG